MTGAGNLDRRVTFRQRAADANGSRTGPWADVVTRAARIVALKGGEGVQAARMAGQQPVIITVRRGRATAAVDNSYSIRDADDLSTIWDVTSKITTEDRAWVEILAVERPAGGEEDE